MVGMMQQAWSSSITKVVTLEEVVNDVLVVLGLLECCICLWQLGKHANVCCMPSACHHTASGKQMRMGMLRW